MRMRILRSKRIYSRDCTRK